MGAWHYGPFDNDTALDWVGGIEQEIAKRIRRELTAKTSFRDGHMQKVAAAALLVELTEKRVQKIHLNLEYEAVHSRLFTIAIEAIQKAREDSAAIAAWNDPKAYADAIDHLLGQLKWRKIIAVRRCNRLTSTVVVHRPVPAKKSHKSRRASLEAN